MKKTKSFYGFTANCTPNDRWKCFFVVIEDNITIGTAVRNGKTLKASSRLKTFEQIVISVWGLLQCGKIV